MLSVLLSAFVAQAAASAGPGIEVRDMVWTRAPTAAEVQGVYPERALALRQNGEAAVDCTVRMGGRLDACALAGEYPRGLGFGAAAMRLAPMFRSAPTSGSGVMLVGRRVRFGVEFRTGELLGGFGSCEAARLLEAGQQDDAAALQEKAAELARGQPLDLDAGAAAASIRGHVARLQTMRGQAPATYRNIAQVCAMEPEQRRNLPSSAPPARTVWIDPAGRTRVVERAYWSRLPDRSDVDRYYPAEAKRRHLNGDAMVTCRVTERGALTGCLVVDETPPGLGFGQAALRLAQDRFRMKPQQVDGQPMSGVTIRVPIAFRTY